MIDFKNHEFLKLKQDLSYREKVIAILIDGEEIVDAYSSMRDGLIFTNKRIIALDVQGMTGSKKDFTSLPYSKIVAYSVETAGTFDFDSELDLWFSSVGRVRFEFSSGTDILEISKHISKYVL